MSGPLKCECASREELRRKASATDKDIDALVRAGDLVPCPLHPENLKLRSVTRALKRLFPAPEVDWS